MSYRSARFLNVQWQSTRVGNEQPVRMPSYSMRDYLRVDLIRESGQTESMYRHDSCRRSTSPACVVRKSFGLDATLP